MGVVDYSKQQLKTVRSPFEEHWSKPHASDYAHLLQLTYKSNSTIALYWLLPPIIVM